MERYLIIVQSIWKKNQIWNYVFISEFLYKKSLFLGESTVQKLPRN